ncbi:MAG: phosphoadenosine phosphosulfate reductase domain-containing protein [Promethearchaeota archaeon]
MTNQRVKKQKKKPPYLGKNKLYWCPFCNVPIMESITCPICKRSTKQIPITPPFDFRPAFNEEVEFFREIIDQQFILASNLKENMNIGKILIPRDRICIVNKIPAIDYAYEIIVSGCIIGVILFDPLNGKYKFNPKYPSGLKIVQHFHSCNNNLYFNIENLEFLGKTIYISKDAAVFVLNGKSILSPGVLKLSDNIEKGDHCLIISEDNKYCSIGIALNDLADLKQMKKSNYGKIAKNLKKNINPFWELEIEEIKQKDLLLYNYLQNIENYSVVDLSKNKFTNWKSVYHANQAYIESLVDKSINFIKKSIKKIGKKVLVSYSGGKDSLCVLLLVYKTIERNFNILFADTGLELPEVIENTKKVAKILKMEDNLVIRSAGKDTAATFWKLIETFGPPSRDFRFCCHTLKAKQIISYLEEYGKGDKVLCFLGQRRYESFGRAQEKMIYINSFIPLQIAATPIKNWCAMDVWLFLLFYPHIIDGKKEEIPINPLYFKGFERLGCYLCPASSLATLSKMQEIHPTLINKWNDWLKNYSRKFNYPKEWLNFGLWRFKNPNKQWRNRLSKIGIKYDLNIVKYDLPLEIKITKGFSPCGQGGYSIKGRCNSILDLNLIKNIISIIPGKIDLFSELGIISVKNKEFLININADGSFFIQFWEKNYKYKRLIRYVGGIIIKSHHCNGCGVCKKICPSQIIQIIEIKKNEKKEGKKIYYPKIYEPAKCKHCSKCITHCPLYSRIKETLLEQLNL